MELPIYRDFTSYEIDLIQLQAALSYQMNWTYLEKDCIPPSPLLLEIKENIQYRERLCCTTVLSGINNPKEDRQLYEKYFALRLAMTDFYEIPAFIDYQVQHSFEGDWIEIEKMVARVFMSNRRWFPLGCDKEVSVKDFLKNKLEVIQQDQRESERKGLTIAQSVLALMIINRETKLFDPNNRKPFQDFISALIGAKNRKVGDFMAKFNEVDGFLLQTSKKQNLHDYEVIKEYFKKIKRQECLEFIDNQIDKIKKLAE